MLRTRFRHQHEVYPINLADDNWRLPVLYGDSDCSSVGDNGSTLLLTINLQVILTGGANSFQDFIGEILPYEKIIIYQTSLIFQLPSAKIKEFPDCLIYTWVENKESVGNPGSNLHSIMNELNTDSICKALLGEKFLEDMFCIGCIGISRDKCQVTTAAPATCGSELQGIMSWATACILTDHTIVFTDISSYIPWIENIISTK
ncbi:hypothetical protein E2I00_018890 [Balaenoptera physalus]|uniref:trypsin n=1 Tax=Balaenoptera physalus TaxID=9770 RepID=A0A6A1Q7U8_BALPH|nr:hypothetical protein E2I00_018890 [Balaenoptera physalus]